eukprot:Selendium_serpulae@DN1460_c0_g1_i2.p1
MGDAHALMSKSVGWSGGPTLRSEFSRALLVNALLREAKRGSSAAPSDRCAFARVIDETIGGAFHVCRCGEDDAMGDDAAPRGAVDAQRGELWTAVWRRLTQLMALPQQHAAPTTGGQRRGESRRTVGDETAGLLLSPFGGSTGDESSAVDYLCLAGEGLD